MFVSINFKIQSQNVVQGIAKIEDGITNLMDVFQELIKKIPQYINNLFEKSQSTWHPLSEKYLAWKKKHGYPAKIGFLTGTMFRAMSGIDTSRHYRVVEPQRLEWGIQAFEPPYPDFFHYGTKKMKSRPLYRLFPEDTRDLLKEFVNIAWRKVHIEGRPEQASLFPPA